MGQDKVNSANLYIFESCKKKECSSLGGNWGDWGVGGDGSERRIRRREGEEE